MRKLNNKGFTLVELIATIVILALVVGISSYSITSIISNSKEKDYELLVKEIKNAVELYYQECKFTDNSVTDSCPTVDGTGYYTIHLRRLVEFGYLKGNGKKSDDEYTLVNPNDGESIVECIIKYKLEDGKIVIEPVSNDGSCPTSY